MGTTLTDKDVFGFSDEEVFAPSELNKSTFDTLMTGLGSASPIANVLQPGTTAREEAGKAFTEQAKNLFAGGLKGFGALANAGAAEAVRDALKVMDTVDSGESVTPALDVFGYQDMNPVQRKEIRDFLKTQDYQNRPITDNSLYQTGAAIEEFGKEALKSRPEWKDSWTRSIAGGAGSMAAGGVTAWALGPGVAGGLFAGAGAGEAVDRAIKKTTDIEEQRRAAMWGLPVGMTDMVDNMLPFLKAPKTVAKVIGNMGGHALWGAFIEGGQEGLQQFLQNGIAKGIYDPKQALADGVPESFVVGALLGGATGAIAGAATDTTTSNKTTELTAIAGPLSDAEVFGSQVTPQTEAESGPIWVSRLYQAAVNKLPNQGSPEQIITTLRNQPGIKQEEIDAMGLESFLARQKGPVRKDDVISYLEENALQVTEILHGPPEPRIIKTLEDTLSSISSRETELRRRSFSVLDTPLTPEEQAELDHLPKLLRIGIDELAALKTRIPLDRRPQYDEYALKDAGKSDYRELLIRLPTRGYYDENYIGPHWQTPNVVAHIRFTERVDTDFKSPPKVLHIEEIQSDWMQDLRKNDRGELPDGTHIPRGPFKSSWVDLSLKRMLRWAADNGYSRITWNTGEMISNALLLDRGSAEERGNIEFYDTIIPSRLKKIVKSMGGTFGKTVITLNREAVEWDEETDFLVPYVDIPPRAVPIIKKGLSLFSKRNEVTIKSTATNPTRRAEALKIAQVLEDLTKQFNIGAPVRIVIQDDFTEPGMLGLTNLRTDGSFTITIATNRHRTLSELYTTAMHEFGHVVMFSKFYQAPRFVQMAVEAEYRRWRQQQRLNNPTQKTHDTKAAGPYLYYESMGARARLLDTPLYKLPIEYRDYITSMEEWFADQVARWATTDKTPVTVAERYIKGIAKILLGVMQALRKKFGLVDVEPTAIMSNWLTAVMQAPNTGEAFKQIFDSLHYESLRENQSALSDTPEVKAVPIQHETVAIRQAVDGLFSRKTPREVRQTLAHADRINTFYKWMVSLQQIASINPWIRPLQRYVEQEKQMQIEARQIQEAGLRVDKKWAALGREQGDIVAKVLDYVTNMRYRTDDEIARGVRRHPTKEEFDSIATRFKLTEEGRAVFNLIRRYLTSLNMLTEEEVVKRANLIDDVDRRTTALDAVRGYFEEVRKAPYFPFMRFGNRVLVVKDGAGNVVYQEHFEKRGVMSAEKRMARRWEKLRKQNSDWTAEFVTLDKASVGFIGLPRPLLGLVELKLELTETQRAAIRMLRKEHISIANTKERNLQTVNYTPGYSNDFRRSFGAYVQNFSNYYTKTKWRDILAAEIAAVRNEAKLMPQKQNLRRLEIAAMMQDHFEAQINDAKSDWATLRAVATLWNLGFVAASGIINLTQIPLNTYPTLLNLFGPKRAASGLIQGTFNDAVLVELNGAVGEFFGLYNKGKARVSEFEGRALDYMVSTGRIGQGIAYELSALAQGNMTNGIALQSGSREFQWLLDKSMVYMATTEKINRTVTAMATLRLMLAYPNPRGIDQILDRYALEYSRLLGSFSEREARAIIVANHVVEETQFDTSKHASPKIMRGKARAFFLFKSYMQNQLFWMWKNKGNRAGITNLLLLTALAGFMGIPGAEDAKELLRVFMYRVFGRNFHMERELRKLIMEYTSGDKADLILHGGSKFGFGLPALFNATRPFTGMPEVPAADLSRNLAMGTILPVQLGELFGPPSRDPYRKEVQQMQRGLGAAHGMWFDVYQALANTDNVSGFKRWERLVPRAIRVQTKAWEAFSTGTLASKRGEPTLKFDPRDPTDLMEIALMTTGAQPARVTRYYENLGGKIESSTFYDLQKTQLLGEFYAASKSGGTELAEARENIARYNAALPKEARDKIITGETLQRSMARRTEMAGKRAAGVPRQRSDIGIYREMDRLYPVEVERRKINR